MPVLRTLDEIWEQGERDALKHPPMTQEQADRIAAILAPWRRRYAEAAVPASP